MLVAVVMMVESPSSRVLQRRSVGSQPRSGDAQAPQHFLDPLLLTVDALLREKMGTVKAKATHPSE